MKVLLSILVAITVVMILGTASAYSPLEISGDGVVVKSYDLDLEVNSVILEVQVDDSGSLELTFEREFFDSTNLGEDDEFFAIIDGNKLPYIETETTSKSRTIEASLSSGVYEIEIFGSHLLGKTTSVIPSVSPSMIRSSRTSGVGEGNSRDQHQMANPKRSPGWCCPLKGST